MKELEKKQDRALTFKLLAVFVPLSVLTVVLLPSGEATTTAQVWLARLVEFAVFVSHVYVVFGLILLIDTTD